MTRSKRLTMRETLVRLGREVATVRAEERAAADPPTRKGKSKTITGER